MGRCTDKAPAAHVDRPSCTGSLEGLSHNICNKSIDCRANAHMRAGIMIAPAVANQPTTNQATTEHAAN